MDHAGNYLRLPGKSRRYRNVDTGKEISLRQYQKLQRGGITYTEYVKKKGGKREYKTKGHVNVKMPKPQVLASPAKTGKSPKQVGYIPVDKQRAQERVRRMKQGFALKRGYSGYDEMPTEDKSAFWEAYHRLMDKRKRPPSRNYFKHHLQDFYEMEYEDWLDLSYGDTP